MTVRHQQDIDGLRRVGALVAQVLSAMRDAATAGTVARDLDAYGGALLREAGARSAPALTYGFPGATCISVNEVAAHGVPDGTVLRDGDLVNIDVSAELDGYFADTGASFVVGAPTLAQRRLLDATREARDRAIARLRAGERLNGIGRTVEAVAARRGFRVIRNLGSHGVGRALHEAPGSIPGHYDPRDPRRLHEGMVITVEPFLATHCTQVRETGDGWSLVCPRGVAAQFEHTVIVTRGEPIVVT
ncbi:type I methionyl aminopeptidase [Vulcaniibacterium tengchongense]|uniref:Methionine aminopeptidase n=1 Tax=Vulcaniibacterium tengchongense TaxID=1273429 RepID=A0A3N4VIL9_9GAMM|nr:type I methionyl aminopeptidase [Vulcaniibacterium tengchongense]RPE79549.1 methionine aminopeptidase type I [Vulcaniibacterium tengchongense]